MYSATIPSAMHFHSTQKNFQQFFDICKRLKYCQLFIQQLIIPHDGPVRYETCNSLMFLKILL